MGKPFSDLKNIQDRNEKINYIIKAIYSKSKERIGRERHMEELIGFRPGSDESKLVGDNLQNFRKYQVFSDIHFCQGEANRANLFLGIARGIMMNEGYSVCDILEAQYGSNQKAFAREQELCQEILNCFPVANPQSLSDEDRKACGEKLGKMMAAAVKGLETFNYQKELMQVMDRTGTPYMNPKEFSHTPEGMLFSSLILENVSASTHEFSQQLGRSFGRDYGIIVNGPESPALGQRAYFTSMNENMQSEDYSRFNSTAQFFTEFRKNGGSDKVAESYAKFRPGVVQISDEYVQAHHYPDNYIILKGAAVQQTLSDILLDQGSKSIGECQLPAQGYLSQRPAGPADMAPYNGKTGEQMEEEMQNLNLFRQSHLNPGAEKALDAAEDYVKNSNPALLNETPENFTKAISHFLLPGQRGEEISGRFLRLRSPYTLSAEKCDRYIEQQNRLLENLNAKREPAQTSETTTDEYRSLLHLNKEREQLKLQIVSNMKTIATQTNPKTLAYHRNFKLSADEQTAIKTLPVDGFGDSRQLWNLYKDCPDPHKKVNLTFERLFDRMEAFEPSLITDNITLRRYVKAYDFLMSLKEKDVEGYAAGDQFKSYGQAYQDILQQRYPTPEAMARFKEKERMIKVISAGIENRLSHDQVDAAMERYYSNMTSLYQAIPNVIEDRWPARANEDVIARNLRKALDEGTIGNYDLSHEETLFYHTFSRYDEKNYKAMMKEAGVDLFDLIRIDGQSVRDIFDSRDYQHLNDKSEKIKAMMAIVVDAVYSGDKHIDVAQLQRNPETKEIDVKASALQINLKELGRVERGRSWMIRRAFNWARTIRTSATRANDFYKNDTNAAERLEETRQSVREIIQNKKERAEAERKKQAMEARKKQLQSILKDRWETKDVDARLANVGRLAIHLTLHTSPEILQGHDKAFIGNGEETALLAAAKGKDLSELMKLADKFAAGKTNLTDEEYAKVSYLTGLNAPKTTAARMEMLKQVSDYVGREGLNEAGSYAAMLSSRYIARNKADLNLNQASIRAALVGAKDKLDSAQDELISAQADLTEAKRQNSPDLAQKQKAFEEAAARLWTARKNLTTPLDVRGLDVIGQIVKDYTTQIRMLPDNEDKVDNTAVKAFRFMDAYYKKNDQNAYLQSYLGSQDMLKIIKGETMTPVSGKAMVRHIVDSTPLPQDQDLAKMLSIEKDNKDKTANLYESSLYRAAIKKTKSEFEAVRNYNDEHIKKVKDAEVVESAKHRDQLPKRAPQVRERSNSVHL